MLLAWYGSETVPPTGSYSQMFFMFIALLWAKCSLLHL